MRIRIFLCLTIFMLTAFHCFCQVNLQTGATQVTIPLYSYNDPNNRLSTDVSLIYTAGNGTKVNEIASNVGTGWALMTGGYIERVKYGEADDQKNYDTYTYPAFPNSDPQSAFWVWARNYYANGMLQSQFTSSDQITNRGAFTPMYPSPYYYFKPPQFFSDDREQDMFKFSFNGREGYFIISRPNSSGISEIRTIYDSKLKIEKVDGDLNNTQNIRTTISKFIITDENGIKYSFEDADLDQVCDYDQGSEYYASNGSFVQNVSYINTSISNSFVRVIKGTPRNSFTKNKWNLTTITNPLTGVNISFQYETYSVDMNTQKIIQRSISGTNDNVSITQIRSVSQLKRLTKIILSTNETVDLEYSSSGRIDIPADKSLSRITIKYANEIKYKWDFSYGYFVKTDIKDPAYNFSNEDRKWSRLCLLSLKKSGSIGLSEPPYTFDYYRGNEDNYNSAVPPMFSAQQNLGGYYSTSNFGFYNPSNNTTTTSNAPYEPYGDILLPKSVYQNILAGLDYNPSLGYGTGTSAVGPTLEARNGIIKSVTNPLGGQLLYEYEVNDAGTVPSKAFFGVRVKKTTQYDGLNHANDKITEYKYITENNSGSSSWGFENCANKRTVTLLVRQDCQSGIKPLLNMLSIAKSLGNYILGQTGLISSAGTVINIGGTQVPVFAIIYFAYIFYEIFDGFFGNNQPQYNTYNMDVYTNQLVNNNTLPFQYSRVEVVSKLGSGDIGKVVNEFTSPSSSSSNYQIDFPSVAVPYSSKQRCAYWVYGLPERITIKDNSSRIIKKIENVYNPVKYFLNTTPYLSQKWVPITYKYGCGFNPESEELTATDKISSELYYPICGRIELTQTNEYTYNDNNDYTVVTTNYEYSTNNYMPNRITSANSKGEFIETKTYYPQDYALTGPVQSLKDNNMINMPLSSQTLITKSGPQKYVTQGSVTEYGFASNGDIKPITSYSLRNDVPVLDFLSTVISTELLPRSTTYPYVTFYQPTGTITYNSNGLPVQISTDNGMVSTIYDYDNKLAVATVANASADDIAYSSFEAVNSGGVLNQPTSSGGWLLSQGSTIVTDRSFTGKKSFSGRIDKTLSHPGNYTLTLWNLWNVTVNGQAGTVVATTDNWQLLKWDLTNVSSITILADNVDEVRLCPANARMTTITYDPLFGKTSESDANNRVFFYQYDNLGRLKTVKDEKLKVIKAYEYNFKQ